MSEGYLQLLLVYMFSGRDQCLNNQDWPKQRVIEIYFTDKGLEEFLQYHFIVMKLNLLNALALSPAFLVSCIEGLELLMLHETSVVKCLRAQR